MKNRFLANAPLFAPLDADERQALAEHFTLHSFADGEALYQQGATPQALYLIKSGVVRLIEKQAQGHRTAATLGPSSVTGELDLLLQRPHPVTALAQGAVDCWELTRGALSELLRVRPAMSIKLSTFLGERIADVDQYLVARLRSVPMLSSVDDRSLYALAAVLELQAIRRGGLIFQAGMAAGRMYFIESGTVTIVSSTPDDPEPFRQLGIGEVFGHEAMLRERPYGSVARAASDVQLWVLSREAWEQVAATQHTLRTAIATYLRDSTLAPADREAAAQTLNQIEIFREISPALQELLVARMTLRHAGTNETIFTEGEPGSAFYLVDKGAVKVLEGEVLMQRLEEGSSFGELALLTGKPYDFTTRAARPTNLWVLHKRDFDSIAVRHPEVTAAVSRALAQLLAQENEEGDDTSLAMFPLFTGLTPHEQVEVARKLRTLYVNTNGPIFRQGAVAEALYLVKKGQVRLTSGQGVFDLVRPGGFFGEMALLTRNNQNVAAEAIEDTELLVMERAHFEAVMARFPSVSLALSRALSARLEAADLRGAVPMMTPINESRPAPVTNTEIRTQARRSRATAFKVMLVLLPLLWLIGITAPNMLLADAEQNPNSPVRALLELLPPLSATQ